MMRSTSSSYLSISSATVVHSSDTSRSMARKNFAGKKAFRCGKREFPWFLRDARTLGCGQGRGRRLKQHVTSVREGFDTRRRTSPALPVYRYLDGFPPKKMQLWG